MYTPALSAFIVRQAAQLAEHAANKHAKLPEAQCFTGLAAMRDAEAAK